MFRNLIRIGVLVAALGSALALSGSALANPTTPQLNPIPSTVFAGPLTVSWSSSAFDPNLIAAGYVLTVTDHPGAPVMPFSTDHFVSAPSTSKTINVSAGHIYILQLRAMEVTSQFEVKLSGSDYEVFEAIKQFKIPDFYEEYYEWPPKPPWCLTCPPFELFFGDDPLDRRARAIFGEPRVYERSLAGTRIAVGAENITATL